MWNDIKYNGSQTDFLKLIDYELESTYKHKLYGVYPGDPGLMGQLKTDLETTFTASADLTLGNVTATTLDFFVGHGSTNQTTALGDHWRLSFTNLAKTLNERASASGVPIAYVTCHRNSYDMSVKLLWDTDRVVAVWGPKGSRKCHRIIVEPMGRSHNSTGVLDRWKVVTWDPESEHHKTDVSGEVVINP